MKPVQSTTTQIDTLPGESVNFTLSAKNTAWIMRSLADLYSNRELAVIREYSTNARDAMIEASRNDIPIEVTLPSMNNPTFSVTDTGVGMNRTELAEVYTDFGESTKRESDDYNGLLGFGSKSAVAYTNTFTITSIKDGYKNVGVITRSEDAMGGYIVKLKFVIDNLPTTERNGTKIEVPVHNWQEFSRKAKDFYRFWIPGTVMVDGVEPEWAVGDKLDEGLFISKASASHVVMGNVAYPIANPAALFPRGMNQITFVAYVDNGTVEFTPNREALKYSEHTKKNLHKIIEDFCDTAVAKAKEEIAASKTHWEAFNAWTTWNNIVGVENVPELYFRGEKLAQHLVIEGWHYNSYLSRYATGRISKWAIASVPNTLFITEFGASVNFDQRKKAKEYAKLKGITAKHYVFTSGVVASPWVDPGRVVTWDALKAALPAKPKALRARSAAPGRLAGSFDLISRTGRQSEKDVPDTKDLYFVMVQEYNGGRNLSAVLDEFALDYEVVLVPANRKNRFLRHYGHARPIWPHLETLVELNGPSLLTPDAQTYFKIHPNYIETLKKLDPVRVDDPDIKEAIRVCKVGQHDYLKDYSKHQRLARLLGSNFIAEPDVYSRYGNHKKNPLLGYPLTDTIQLEHSYVYMNAVFAARKAGKIV